ncbi:MazG nucleotide pyrophosphohydrolase domain-containing protein [Legionella sp. km772]|uniref:MazG nucleotide pyrophosphohydrolase domain-containing protein n=1 Tax=Legionella sp. km772 TaxID=2498111 RepID=UPI000F8D917E|nr:MazG nucleotide pyrophosphohydrolase domain-containing protein [Legionella sp. km772]RUR12940.1 nucleoside triphosphate hydrolase [Legionella sp. km772]
MELIKKLITLEQDAAEFGFEWETAGQIMQQIQSECLEVNEHLQNNVVLSNSSLQEEIGDLLHAVFSLCLFCNLDPEQTLEGTLIKFEKRLKMVKIIAAEKGMHNVKNKPFELLMKIWDEAKNRV